MKNYKVFLLGALVVLMGLGMFANLFRHAFIPITQATAATSASGQVLRTIELTQFNKLELATSGDILFTPTDGEMSAQLSVPADVADDVEVYVKDGKLVFRNKVGRNLVMPRNTVMTLTVSAPMVENILLNGSGDINIQAPFTLNTKLRTVINGSGNVKFDSGTCNEFSLLTNGSGDVVGTSLCATTVSASVNGSGNFKLSDVQATKLSTSVKGSGDVTLQGRCGEAAFTVIGSGNVKASTLKAQTVNVKVIGSGDVECYATDQLSVNRIGSGNIGYKGKPIITGVVKKGLYSLSEE